MVNVSSGAMLVVAVLLSPAENGEDLPPVDVTVIAVQACKEGRREKHFDPGTEQIRDAVADLEFDTYHKVKSAAFKAPYSDETRTSITKRYRLCVKPLSRGRDGRIKLELRLQIMPEKDARKREPINALVTTVVAADDKKFKLRGMKLDKGELVVVLAVRSRDK